MVYLLAGPFVAIVGIAAVFFVLRRKSVDKRSMYSARRSQIEHKVRAARQRTMAPHGHAEKPAEPAPAAPPFEQAKVQPTVAYEVTAYQAPPAAPPLAAPASKPQHAPEPPPWEQAPLPQAPAAPSSFDYPAAPPEPFTPAPAAPFRPAPEPTPMPPSEPSWTPAPRPSEPLAPAETVTPAAPVAAASSTSAGGWSVVSTSKDAQVEAEPGKKKKKDKGAPAAGDWSLASGDAPGLVADEPALKRPSGKVIAIAQYAVLVVGLVMVLIGVLVMVANSHVT